MGMVRNLKGKGMNVAGLMWWEEERLLTETDKVAIEKAKTQAWEDIDEDTAETEIGRRWVHDIATRKYHYEEARSGLL